MLLICRKLLDVLGSSSNFQSSLSKHCLIIAKLNLYAHLPFKLGPSYFGEQSCGAVERHVPHFLLLFLRLYR